MSKINNLPNTTFDDIDQMQMTHEFICHIVKPTFTISN